MKFTLLSIAIILSNLGCQSQDRTSKEQKGSSGSCAARDMQEMPVSYDIGSLNPINCISINRVVGTAENSVRISLSGINDKVWPKLFLAWSGKMSPATGINYPKQPAAGVMPGYNGISLSTLTSPMVSPEENKLPEITDMELTFSSLADSADGITQGVLTLHQSGKVTRIAFSAKTAFRNP